MAVGAAQLFRERARVRAVEPEILRSASSRNARRPTRRRVWNKLRRKWQVQYVVGRRRYSVSSHSDYERAYRDYGLARSRFNLFGGESFIKLMGRPAKRAIFNDPTTLLGKPRAR
jgi:hypothetical protein